MANIQPTPAGELRSRVTILAPQSGVPDEFNVGASTTTTVRTVWAKVTPVSGTEKMLNAADQQATTHEVRMRWCPFVDHTCTLSYQGRTLDIVDVLDVAEQRTELLITCVEQRGATRG